jgi:hypothetical protein
MGFATSLEMKSFFGEDEGVENGNDETTSPSGIAVETLLNMGTVSALTMEEERFNMFKEALINSDEHYIRDGFHQVRPLFTYAHCSLLLRCYLHCSPPSLYLFRIIIIIITITITITITIGRPCGTFNVYSTMDQCTPNVLGWMALV